MQARLTPLLLTLALSACGGKQKAPPAAVETQTPAQEVLRLGNLWTSVTPDQGILSPPSPISVFGTQRKSSLQIAEDAVYEKLTIDEEIQLRDGPVIKCSTVFEHQVGHRWGRKNGEPALEIVRPELHAPRSCSAPHPGGPIAEPEKRALFVLRSDNLVAIEPVVDKRTYIPGEL